MKSYTIKKLINGYRVQIPQMTVVGVPDSKLGSNFDTDVEFNGQHMIIKAGQKPLTTKSFPDQFNRERFYTLCYFEWIPDIVSNETLQKQQSLI